MKELKFENRIYFLLLCIEKKIYLSQIMTDSNYMRYHVDFVHDLQLIDNQQDITNKIHDDNIDMSYDHILHSFEYTIDNVDIV